MKKTIIFLVFIFFGLAAFSQSDHFYLKAGTQVPFQHNIGSEFVLRSRIGFQLQYGVITAPYEGYIKRFVALYENDPNLLKIIENSFQSGSVWGAGFNYHFSKNYIGGFGQYISLQSASSAADALSAYYGYDFSFLNFLIGPINLKVQSNLYNAGILYGRRIILRAPDLQLHLELGVSKNFTSRNNIASDRPNLDQMDYVNNLYVRVDDSMRESFLTYLIIPSFNVYLVYNLMGR